MSVQQVLDFVRTAYQVNAAVEGSPVNVDWNALSTNPLLAALKEQHDGVCTSSLEEECSFQQCNSLDASTSYKGLCGDSTEKQSTSNSVENEVPTVGVEKKTEHRRLMSRRRSSVTVKKEPCRDTPVRSNIKRRLNQVLQEGILDSVLPYILSNSKRVSATSPPEHNTPAHENKEFRSKLQEMPEKSEMATALPNFAKREIRRKSTSSLDCKTTEKKDVDVIIHVCDEVKNTKKDLRCPQSLLVSRMRYFAQVTAGQRLDEMDISVHCDISIFEWLIRWVKTEGSPALNTSIVIPVLMSSAFLQMDTLQDTCLEFCRAHINEVIRDSSNLACINDSVLSRLANMFSNTEVEALKDRKDKLVSKLYCKLIMFLTEVVPQARRGHYASIAYLFRCGKCGEIVSEPGSVHISCIPSMTRMDEKGVIVSEHVRETGWSLSEMVRTLKTQLLTWRRVYWRLWGLCHHLTCTHCHVIFPVSHISRCRQHSEPAQFFSMEHQRTMSFPVGRYPCCGQKTYRFELLPSQTGCQMRDHTPDLRTETAAAIMKIYKQHRELIRIGEDKPASASATSTSTNSEANTSTWHGLQLVPSNPETGHQGLLARWMETLIKPQDKRSPSECKSALPLVVAPTGWRSTPASASTPAAADSDSSSGHSSQGGSESVESGEESDGERYRPTVTLTSKPCNSSSFLTAPPLRKDCGQVWLPKLSTRCNQDNQREFEERAMRQIKEMLTKKTAGGCLRAGHQSAGLLNPAGAYGSPLSMLPASLTLSETKTLTLCSIESCYYHLGESSGEPKAEQTEKEVLSVLAETQTAKHSSKYKSIATLKTHVVNSFVNASAWDLYDTFAKVISGDSDDALDIKHFQLLIDTAFASRGVALAAGSEWTVLPGDVQMKRLVGMDKFQYCVLAVERLLASHTYSSKQMAYTSAVGDSEAGRARTSCQLSLLWTYDSSRQAMPVTCFDLNPRNPMLLAVGYGHLNLEQVDEGRVSLWSPKNPSHPERTILLPTSVTSLVFSKVKPNILAVACRDGNVFTIDVADCSVTQVSRGGLPERYGPIWKIIFVKEGDEESILSVGHGGIITKFSMNKFRPPKELIALEYTREVETFEKEDGSQLKQPSVTYASKLLSGLSLSMVQGQDTCYISTSQGLIAKCRVVMPCRVEAVFSAHVGCVSVIAHSPACGCVFLTCGSDSNVHIWMDDIPCALMTLRSVDGGGAGGAHCAAWSPTHPTLVCCVTNNELHLWDIARSCTDPITVVRMRTRHQCYSVLRFSHDGACIVVGDVFGRVRQYQVENLPRAPFLKLEALTTALRKGLEGDPTRQHLLYQFNKLIHTNQSIFTTAV